MSTLDEIEELLSRTKSKHNTLRETISLIEEYKNNIRIIRDKIRITYIFINTK